MFKEQGEDSNNGAKRDGYRDDRDADHQDGILVTRIRTLNFTE